MNASKPTNSQISNAPEGNGPISEEYLDRPGRLLWTNFLIGVARGLGSTIGLAVVIGLLVFFLQKILMLNLPVISDFIADFIRMVQENYNVLK